MKLYLVAFIILLTHQAYSQVNDQQEIYLKYDQIIAAHKTIYSLPYDYEFKKNTIMAEVFEERKRIAPHFPQREITGEDQVEIREAFFKWIAQYPEEFKLYLNRTHEITRKYQR